MNRPVFDMRGGAIVAPSAVAMLPVVVLYSDGALLLPFILAMSLPLDEMTDDCLIYV